jgi:hypothetical protein
MYVFLFIQNNKVILTVIFAKKNMFVLFGIRKAFIKTTIVPNAICPNCKNSGHLKYNLYRRHFHIFFLPIFPLNKIINVVCGSCNFNFAPENFPKQIIENGKGPKWQYLGLVLIIALFISYKFSTSNAKNEHELFISKPQIGDVYTISPEYKVYTTMKIKNFSTDSIYFLKNKLITNKFFKVYKINKEENFTIEVTYSKKKLRSMDKKSKIFKIKRN